MTDYCELMPLLLPLPVVAQIIGPLLLPAGVGLKRAVQTVFKQRQAALG